MAPVFGSSLPMYPLKFPVNQIFPSRSATKPCGPESSSFSGNSLNVPVTGSSRPSLLAICSVNHSAPSVPTAGSCGCAPFVGTSHSRIVTFSSPTFAPGAAPRDASAIPIPKPRITTPKITFILLLISTSRLRFVLAAGACYLFLWARERHAALARPLRAPLPFGNLIIRAGVVQWQYRSFPSFGRGFDSHRPLQKTAKFTLIRLPLLTSHPSICAQTGRVLRPFCAQLCLHL